MNVNGNDTPQRPEAFPPPTNEAPPVSRPALLQAAWGQKGIVIVVTVVCLAGGMVYLTQATPIFTSTSRIYVEQSGPRIISETEGVMTQSKNYLYTQCELLRSTPILADAVDRSGIRRMKTFADVDNPTDYLRRALQVTVGKKDDIISVSCDSPYPLEAARIVNAVVDSYVTYQAKQKRSTATEILRILQKEKVKREKELGDKLREMLKFKQDNSALSFEDDRGNIIIQRLAKLSDALTGAQMDTVEAKVNYDASKAVVDDPGKIRQLIRTQRASGAHDAINSEEGRIRERLRACRLRVMELLDDHTEQHPAVQVARARVAQLEKESSELEKQLASSHLTFAHQRYVMAKRREEQFQTACDKQQKLAHLASVKGTELVMLRSDLQRSERLCDILDNRIKEINVTEDTGALNISILEVAKMPQMPSKPRGNRIMATALGLGIVLGVGLALLRDWMDQRLRSADEVSAILRIPVMGVIPDFAGKEASPVDCGQKVHLDPDSHAAEAYRTIRTAIYFGVPDGQAKTVLITSPSSGDGKTTLASNLAITMARASQRTLILDADFRKPKQHEIFKIEADEGLCNVLAGRATLGSVIRSTEIEGLDLLPCGPIPPNPSEMLNSQTFMDLLEELSLKYDRVVIDSPPVIPVTDSRIIAALSDVVLLVLRAEKSTRKAAEQAREALLSVGGRLLGAVVNAAPQRRGRYGYYSYGYYGYGDGYGYGYGHKRSGRSRNKEKPGEEAAA